MSSLSKHMVIAAHFRDAVKNGELRSGDKLPSEKEIAQRFSCSVGTVRRGVSTLINEGVVLPRHGVGVFVKEAARRKIIGVVVHNLRNPDHANLVDHVAAAAEQAGHSVMLCVPYAQEIDHESGTRIEMEFVERLTGLEALGVIKCPTTILSEARIRHRVKEGGLSLVMVNDFWSDCLDVHHVVCDRRVAMDLAVDHLMGLGHRRIALYNTPRNEEPGAIEAFRAVTTARGVEGPLLLQGVEEAVRAVRDETGPKRIDAIVTPYSLLAHELIEYLRRADLRVPDDVSIVVLNGRPDERVRRIDCTTIEPPLAVMAQSAVRLLVEGPAAPVVHLHFPPTLHVGNTTAQCAGAACEAGQGGGS